MIRYLTIAEVLAAHETLIATFGGSTGVRDLNLLESAIALPQAGFGGVEFYPTLSQKAAAIGFSIVKNHAFADGNKRTGLACISMFLLLNDHRLRSTADESEATILGVADGSISREQLAEWIERHCKPVEA